MINRTALLNPHNELDVSVSSITGTSFGTDSVDGSADDDAIGACMRGLGSGAVLLMIYSTLVIFFSFFNMILSSTEY